jgi:hypothetical protein
VGDNSDSKTAIAVIEEQADRSIRRVQIGEVWFFSVIDVIGVLTDAPIPRQYWHNMKRYVTTEGFSEVSQEVRQLKMRASDGKMRTTDAADVKTMLRLIQSIPSPKAEPVKQWLAKVGAQELSQTYVAPDTTNVAGSLRSSIAEIQHSKPDDSDLLGMADYYQQLSMVYRQQARLETRLQFVEVATRSQGEEITDIKIRMDELERNQSSLPELLQLLRVELLTPAHQNQVLSWVNELARLTGWHITAIFTDLAADFEYKTFGDAREADWNRIEEYFREKLEDARRNKR